MIEKSIIITNSEYLHPFIRRLHNAGKKTRGAEEVETQKAFEDTKKISHILPVCKTENENIEHYKGKQQREIIRNLKDYQGKYLDIKV